MIPLSPVSVCWIYLVGITISGGWRYHGGRAALAFSTHQYQSSVHKHKNFRCTTVVKNNNSDIAKWYSKNKRCKPLYTSITNDDADFNNDVSVKGVSVSPKGFLVILQSSQQVAFPIALTSTTANNNNNTIATAASTKQLPSLFQENNDQTSVTSPEALTFLQLLNGVDMATPILPPDTLSLICVWYAMLLVEENNIGDRGEEILVEDELGLLAKKESDNDLGDDNNADADVGQEALEYIRAMIKTTLPDSTGGGSSSYIDASPWQRAKVQLPRVWLHGVKLQEMDLSSSETSSTGIGRIPIQFILECSVDDGSRMLDIPLFAIPSSYQPNIKQKMPTLIQEQIDISNEILQELSHNYNSETSAAFMSLALFHRYNKNGAASADSPVLKVSTGLLNQLVKIQQNEEQRCIASDDEGTRYCWAVSTAGDNIDTVIQTKGLPLYRPLAQIQEEDQRVLNHLKEQNFGKDTPSSSTDNMNVSSSSSTESSAGIGNAEKALTLEQQALQQTLKSAWKIATQKEDEGALQKIQAAMEDLEREVMNNPANNQVLPEEVEDSALDKIQRAMQREGKDNATDEDVVGLVSELEDAVEEAFTDNEDEE